MQQIQSIISEIISRDRGIQQIQSIIPILSEGTGIQQIQDMISAIV
jgi:hypothetical protein